LDEAAIHRDGSHNGCLLGATRAVKGREERVRRRERKREREEGVKKRKDSRLVTNLRKCSDTSERIESALLLPSGRRSLTVHPPTRAAGVESGQERDGALITESRFRGPRIVKSMRALSLTFFKGRIEDAINNCPSLIALVPIPPINLRMSCGNLQ